MKARVLRQIERLVRVLPDPIQKDALIEGLCRIFDDCQMGVDLDRFREECQKR